MKKTYTEPEVKIIHFSTLDVIATSGVDVETTNNKGPIELPDIEL